VSRWDITVDSYGDAWLDGELVVARDENRDLYVITVLGGGQYVARWVDAAGSAHRKTTTQQTLAQVLCAVRRSVA
jgi:hypothetical protein